ncbi:hypothetical protein HID58_053595 [Brassica napus]|uniref:TFIIS N-terminal domain-containing protein n=1 Tax=Brassica napus TaxID=3708 RepID=A0ABQ8AF67_BRANA|nr:hypothetical protein HID58_053595 [Brassica napus]
MTIMKPTASLDTWRDHFRRGDSDIFEFKSRRDAITEPLFSCQVSRCIRCDQPELSKAGDKEANNNLLHVESYPTQPSVLFESMTKLASMSISLDFTKGSEIGKAVNRLRKHGSDKIANSQRLIE